MIHFTAKQLTQEYYCQQCLVRVHISQHGIYARSAPAVDSCRCHEAIVVVSLGSQGCVVTLSNTCAYTSLKLVLQPTATSLQQHQTKYIITIHIRLISD